MYHVLLASQSPRRQQLLQQVGFRVTVRPSSLDESRVGTGLRPAAMAEAIARAKGEDVAARSESLGAFLVAADTVVWLDEATVLGKPADADEALRMLRALAGRDHWVTTGVALLGVNPRGERSLVSFHETTKVRMSPVEEEALRAYVRTGEPLDKAGAYGIQGLAGAFVRGIDGSWDNVVGLPVERVIHHAREAGWIDHAPWAVAGDPLEQPRS